MLDGTDMGATWRIRLNDPCSAAVATITVASCLRVLVSYRQFFDLEGESGIVVRAIGTSVTLGKQLAAVTCTSPQPPPAPSVSPNPE